MPYELSYFVNIGGINMSNFISKKYFKKHSFSNLSNIQNLKEFKQNEMQINCIKKVLIEHADVPPKLIDWLIESVQKNVVLQYKTEK